jgi:hypothetical protein
MIRNVETRLTKLEAVAAPPILPRYHRVIGHSMEECEAARTTLIAAGIASPQDNFIFRVIVSH